MFAKCLMVVALATGALSLQPASAELDDTCGRQGTRAVEATITNPENGKASFFLPTTSGAASVPVEAVASAAPGIAVSTTGEIEVQVTHSCLMTLHLTVTDEADTIIYESNQNVPCDDDHVTTEIVEIGLEAGEYSFSLNDSYGCDGAPVKHTGNGHYVADPPLPV